MNIEKISLYIWFMAFAAFSNVVVLYSMEEEQCDAIQHKREDNQLINHINNQIDQLRRLILLSAIEDGKVLLYSMEEEQGNTIQQKQEDIQLVDHINNQIDQLRRLILLSAIEDGNEEKVKWMIDELKVDINAFSYDPNKGEIRKTSPLMVAIAHERINIIKLLLENGVDINRESERGFDPLLFAVFCNEKECIKLLLDYNPIINPNTLNSILENEVFDETREEIKQLFLAKGIDLNKSKKRKRE